MTRGTGIDVSQCTAFGLAVKFDQPVDFYRTTAWLVMHWSICFSRKFFMIMLIFVSCSYAILSWGFRVWFSDAQKSIKPSISMFMNDIYLQLQLRLQQEAYHVDQVSLERLLQGRRIFVLERILALYCYFQIQIHLILYSISASKMRWIWILRYILSFGANVDT